MIFVRYYKEGLGFPTNFTVGTMHNIHNYYDYVQELDASEEELDYIRRSAPFMINPYPTRLIFIGDMAKMVAANL